MTDKNLMTYNTQQPQLLLSEYGRGVQNMVDYCLSIEDRDMRTLCARAIVGVMRRLTPQQANTPEKERKLWDHLNIMAGFALDVDFPYPPLQAEELKPQPSPIPYSDGRIRWRHYGLNIEQMVAVVADMEEGPERDELVNMLAHQMKKLQLVHNPEGVDDAKILRDLEIYSQGKISLDPETYLLHEFLEAPAQQQPRQGGKYRRRKKKTQY